MRVVVNAVPCCVKVEAAVPIALAMPVDFRSLREAISSFFSFTDFILEL